MKNIICALIMSLSSFVGICQSIDTKNSMVTFEISNMGIRSVDGSFTGMKGSVFFTPNDLKNASFEVCIDASSVNTENEKRDEHLKTEDFFEVEKYPEICFNSDKIEKTEDGYITTGALQMHGIEKAVEIPFTYTNQLLKGTLTVNRKDFGIGADYGKFMVGEEVTLAIFCQFKP